MNKSGLPVFFSIIPFKSCFSLLPQSWNQHIAGPLGNNFSHTDKRFPLNNFHLTIHILGKLPNPFPTLLSCRDFAA